MLKSIARTLFPLNGQADRTPAILRSREALNHLVAEFRRRPAQSLAQEASGNYLPVKHGFLHMLEGASVPEFAALDHACECAGAHLDEYLLSPDGEINKTWLNELNSVGVDVVDHIALAQAVRGADGELATMVSLTFYEDLNVVITYVGAARISMLLQDVRRDILVPAPWTH
jgi:hypothetical protein